MCRINLGIVLLLVLSACAGDSLDPSYTYEDYYKEFNRTYEGEQKEGHMNIFKTNFAKLLQLQQNGADVKVTNFTDWNQTQLDSYFIVRSEDKPLTSSKRPLKSTKVGQNPKTFSWKDKQAVTPVKYQGYCGSCWAFSTTAQYESLLAIQSKGKQYDLAEQFVLQCQQNSLGCGGGFPESALPLLIKDGIQLQSDYPYQPSNDKYYLNRGINICEDTKKIKLKTKQLTTAFFSNLSISQIQSDLITNGPFTVGIMGSDLAFNSVGSSGVIQMCSKSGDINHVALLYGYTQTHWLIKNSWGTSWGDQGFAKILKSNDCGVSQEAYQILGVQVTSKPVKVSVTLMDSAGDGWNGYSIGFKQGQTIVGKFGDLFNNGSSQGPLQFQIQPLQMTEIVVTGKGTKSNQIGFKVFDSNGKIIFERLPGQSFTSVARFKTFCLSQDCYKNDNYKLTLYDSFGDGWNNNLLTLKYQNGSQYILANQWQQFKVKQTNINIPSTENISVYANVADEWSNQIGYKLTTSNGLVIMSRTPGLAIKQAGVLNTFCVACSNLQSLNSSSQNKEEQTAKTQVSTVVSEPQDYKSYKIATYSLAAISGILLIAVGLTTFKVCKNKNNQQETPVDNNNSSPMLKSQEKIAAQTYHSSSQKNTEPVMVGASAQPSSNKLSNQSSSGNGQNKQKFAQYLDQGNVAYQPKESLYIHPPLDSNLHGLPSPYNPPNIVNQNLGNTSVLAKQTNENINTSVQSKLYVQDISPAQQAPQSSIKQPVISQQVQISSDHAPDTPKKTRISPMNQRSLQAARSKQNQQPNIQSAQPTKQILPVQRPTQNLPFYKRMFNF